MFSVQFKKYYDFIKETSINPKLHQGQYQLKLHFFMNGNFYLQGVLLYIEAGCIGSKEPIPRDPRPRLLMW